MKSKSEKSVMNIAVLALHEIVSLVCGIIAPRYFLLAFGSDYNGALSSITQMCTFITLLRAGVTGASRLALYKPLADNDTDKISAILMATQRYMRRIAYLFIGYVGVLAVVYPFFGFKGNGWLDVASLVVITALGTFAQYYFGLTYQTLLTADQRHYIYSIIQIFAVIGNTIVTILLIKLGLDIHWVKLGSSIVFCLAPIALNLYVSRIYRINKHAEPDSSVISGKKYVMTHAVANFVHENTDIVLLTFFTDAATVSVYSVYYLVMNGIKKFMTIFTTGMESAFGNMWAKNEKENFRKNFGVFEFLIASFVSVVFSCTFAFILSFVRLYTAGVTDTNYIRVCFAMVVCFAQAVYCIRTPYVTAVQSCGKYKETMNGAIIEAALNLGLSLVLVYWFGLVGVAIGTLAANLFRTTQFSMYVYKNIIQKKYWQFVQKMFWVISNITISLLVFHACRFTIEAWMSWVLYGAICFIISMLITIVMSFVFYRYEMTYSLKIIKKLLQSGTKRKKG
ncbi:MAG: polysaccharide biosynthesis C-terminal domain-containing protein [Sphaerochaetaceae bacterium]|nr:polysaccharide biosynthesis C-terminal domain-containing protein [Sphaerochaetaceae bacterium]